MSTQQDQIREATVRNREEPDPGLERELLQLRFDAWPEIAVDPPTDQWPTPRPDLFPGGGIPDLPYTKLTSYILDSCIQHHNAVIVRGLLEPDQAEALNGDIDATLDAVHIAMGRAPGEVPPEWFTPFPGIGPDFEIAGKVFLHDSGTVWTGESPRTLFHLIDALEGRGLATLLTDHLGERPALSLIKCAMRRVPPDAQGGWHQDGYVLGNDTRVLNVWIATSACGSDAPGLDLLPRKMDTLAPTFLPPPLDFCVSDDTVAELAVHHPVIRPEFAAGDAIFFDQLLLHRTGSGPGLTLPRYGFECWFFAPSTFPTKWVPIVF